MPFSRPLLLAVTLLLCAAGCGTPELPAFANPPPSDAGSDRDAGPDR